MEIRYERNAQGMFDNTPAGSWRENRLQKINPFRKKETVYEFVPTTEAQTLLDEYSSRIGRDMKVKHFGEEQLEDARRNVPNLDFTAEPTGGVFQPHTPDRVFLQKDANLATLVHELEHAADPNVSQQAYAQFVAELEADSPVHNYYMSIPNSDQRANIFRHYSQGPLRTYDYELLAEKAASDYEKKRGFDYKDIGDYPSHYLNEYMDNWTTSPAWRHYESTTNPDPFMEETGFSRARPYQKAQKEYVDELRSDDVFRGAVDEYFNKSKAIYDRYTGTGS